MAQAKPTKIERNVTECQCRSPTFPIFSNSPRSFDTKKNSPQIYADFVTQIRADKKELRAKG
jgi:hypothetical protein